MKHSRFLITSALTLLLGLGVGAGLKLGKAEVKTAKADYSSTIRVYVDLGWDSIDYVRVGGNAAGNNCVLTTSNAKYNQKLGKYVLDISSGSTYDKMGCFFSQSGTAWEYQYDGGYIWIDDSKFQPGYEFQIKNINWVADGNPKKFSASVYRIGAIRDNAQNSTFYFVDGYSWHASRSVTCYFWGGTASCSAYPGETMTDSSLRLKAYVGETEFTGLHIYQYTLSGSAAYVKFSNNDGGQATGDLALTDGGVYFFGVNGEYDPVVELLISLKNNLGSYSYNGKSFTSSICHLTQSQASTFVSTYDTLVSTGGSGIASSVPGSGLVTYDTPETSNTHTGEISLEDVRAALLKKYPSITPSGRIALVSTTSESVQTGLIIAIVAGIALVAVGGYFFLRRKEDR